MPKPRVIRHAVVQPPDQSIRLIPLTQGQNAIVDAADYEWLSRWNWFARRDNRTHSFYAGRREGGQTIWMHRVVLQCVPNCQTDHCNHNTLDNRRVNLRQCTPSENQWNRKISRNNSSGFKGVHWNKRVQKWVARIRHCGEYKYLGGFEDLQDAIQAYKNAAKDLHGAFACIS